MRISTENNFSIDNEGNIFTNKNNSKVTCLNDAKTQKIKRNRKNIRRTTTTVILREARIALKEEEEEQKKLLQLLEGSPDLIKCEKLLKYERQRENELFKIKLKKLHVLGQLSYEKAQLAKKRFIDECKKRTQLYKNERIKLKEELKLLKEEHEKRVEELVQRGHEIEERVKQNRAKLIMSKRHEAMELNEQIKEMISKAAKEHEIELKRKMFTIQQLRTLRAIRKGRKKIKVKEFPKEHGLLCEMSLEELKNRLRFTKLKLKNEIAIRRTDIRINNKRKKNLLKNIEKYIKTVRENRKKMCDEGIDLSYPETKNEEIAEKLKEIDYLTAKLNRVRKENERYKLFPSVSSFSLSLEEAESETSFTLETQVSEEENKTETPRNISPTIKNGGETDQSIKKNSTIFKKRMSKANMLKKKSFFKSRKSIKINAENEVNKSDLETSESFHNISGSKISNGDWKQKLKTEIEQTTIPEKRKLADDFELHIPAFKEDIDTIIIKTYDPVWDDINCMN